MPVNKVISIYIVDTVQNIIDFFKQTLEKNIDFAFVGDSKMADIIIKIDDDIAHFYAKDSYSFIHFPCKLESFILKIKSFFYLEINEYEFEYNGIRLCNNYLIYNNQNILLSKGDYDILRLIIKASDIGIMRDDLIGEIGTGANSAIYRLRRKLSVYNINIKLYDDKFFIKTY